MSDLVKIIAEDPATIQSFKDVYGEAAESKLRQEAGFLPSIMATNPVLSRCSPASIKFALVQVAILGLSIMPSRKQAYLVPFGSTCQLLIGKQGKIDMLASAGAISSGTAGSVRKNDFFDYEKTEKGFKYTHKKPKEGPRGPIIGAYACLYLPSGLPLGEYATMEEINKRKAIAKSGKFWNAWDDEMCSKTAVHIAVKNLPSNAATDKINTADRWIYDIEGEQVETTPERMEELRKMFSVKDTGLRQSVYLQLPEYERENSEVKALYKEVNAEMKTKQLKSNEA